jgi:UDPglucose 6-dehydrogenase
MGDGGACHPRDLLALSWLERQMDASFPLFGILAGGREQQARWLAGLVRSWAELTGLEVAILGKSYKPGSDLTDGSPALLLAHYLDDVNGGGFPPGQYDPHTENTVIAPVGRKVFVIATRHEEFRNWDYEPGSVVIDPFGYIPDSPGVTVIRVGRKK